MLLPRSLARLAVLALVGCAPRAGNAPAAPRTPTSAATDAAPPPPPSAPPPPPAVPSRAPVRPEAVPRTGKVWPFHTWTRAEAAWFNRFFIRADVPLLAYDDVHGYSPHISDRRPISNAQAAAAVELAAATNGDVEVSKCPFPRHAVILFDGETPVASINVSFECGDILTWPRFAPAPASGTTTDLGLKRLHVKQLEQERRYARIFPRWRTFFRDDVGLPIDERYVRD
jgi:hypothetical protein